jgi:DNA primase
LKEGGGVNRISDEFVDELRRRLDIVDIISEYVQLRRSGRSYTGLCPFHNEKTPSFSVSPERQYFHCFGCGAGGTVIRFVMDIEGLTFMEAVTKLAARANMQLPVTVATHPADEIAVLRTQRLKEAHELSAKFYNYILMNTTAGVQALTYLESRGISRQTIAFFQLGYAPDAANQLTSLLLRRGYDADLLVDAGLSVKMGNQLVDRFRGRVMIPICDAQGHVVAFGGRTLLPDGKPKYLNSPETAIFHKSSSLFHQHHARKTMRKTQTAILMEGYMDVISAWQAGITNAVATLGTSLTPEQANAIKRYAERVIVAYDGDEAGVKAAERALFLCEQAGLEVRIAVFPDGLDPDEFIRLHGGPAFERLTRSNTLTGTEFLLKQLRDRAELESSAGRTEFLRKALELLGTRASPIERDTELRRLSHEFQVSLEALRDELFRITKQTHKRRVLVSERMRRFQTSPIPPAVNKLPSGAVTAGNRVLQLVFTDDRAFRFVYEAGVDELALPEQTALLARYYGYRAEHPDGNAASFVDTLDDEDLRRLASSLFMENPVPFNEDVLEDYLRTIQLHHLEVEYKQGLEQIVQAQLAQDLERVESLRIRVEQLKHQITQLKTPRDKAKPSLGAKEAGV